jgi:RNA polymerase sigma-70 factor (ECF subfamily)
MNVASELDDRSGVSVEQLNRAIVASYASLLRRALYLTRDRADAMDLVQRTVERACRSRRQLRPGSNPAHWLGAILNSQFVDESRRKKTNALSHMGGYETLAAPPAAVRPIWGELELDDVLAAARRLPRHLRQPFQLHYLRGLRQRAVGERLGVATATIATRIYRAKRLLRRMLTEALRNGTGTQSPRMSLVKPSFRSVPGRHASPHPAPPGPRSLTEIAPFA